MQRQIEQWKATGDRRAIFLSCYQLMTDNMLAALTAGAFHDPAWVGRLLHHFADYYFLALDDYDRGHPATPAVWQIAHDAANTPGTWTLQSLLLGVNAHINYDLVLALADVLGPEWPTLSAETLALRHADHCQINTIIAASVNMVQDQLTAEWTPGLGLLDKALGPLDETLTARLIAHWRETVWQDAQHYVETDDLDERERLRLEVAAAATARAASLLNSPYRLDELL